MKRQKIVVDMDGVCADFAAGFTKLGKMLGLLVNPISTPTQATYGFDDLPREVKALIWDKIIASPRFWRDLPSLLSPEEIVALRNLEKHELYFLTARLGNNPKGQTEMWLAERGIYCPTVVVLASYRPDPTLHAPLLKRAFCKAIGAHWFIDDKPAIVREVGFEPGILSVLREWQYSKDFEHPLRVTSFLEFAEMINNG